MRTCSTAWAPDDGAAARVRRAPVTASTRTQQRTTGPTSGCSWLARMRLFRTSGCAWLGRTGHAVSGSVGHAATIAAGPRLRCWRSWLERIPSRRRTSRPGMFGARRSRRTETAAWRLAQGVRIRPVINRLHPVQRLRIGVPVAVRVRSVGSSQFKGNEMSCFGGRERCPGVWAGARGHNNTMMAKTVATASAMRPATAPSPASARMTMCGRRS